LKLHLGGHLSFYEPQRRAWVDLVLPEPQRLPNLLAGLGIPPGEVALVVINGELAQEDKPILTDEDQVELYPPMGGGLASPQEYL
jgi:sulfur carrier protein ThiS